MSETNNEFEQLLEETSSLRKMRSFLTSATKQMVSLPEMSTVINPALI